MRKNTKIYLFLTILLAFSFACLLPGLSVSSNPGSSDIGAKTKLPTVLATREILPTLTEVPACRNGGSSGLFANVLADENGGLNLRTLPLDLGGTVILVLEKNELVEIFSDYNNWSFVRVIRQGEVFCGYVNSEFLEIK